MRTSGWPAWSRGPTRWPASSTTGSAVPGGHGASAMERAVARIDLGALRANCERLRSELGEARLCAVVKADGYGHGAVACAEAAVAGGATTLAVAAASEAAELAEVAPDLLTLGALTGAEVDVVLGAGSAISVWTPGFLD